MTPAEADFLRLLDEGIAAHRTMERRPSMRGPQNTGTRRSLCWEVREMSAGGTSAPTKTSDCELSSDSTSGRDDGRIEEPQRVDGKK
jgi:hypothetical protein